MAVDPTSAEPRTILVGIFDAETDASRAAEALAEAGFLHVRVADAAISLGGPEATRSAAMRGLLELHPSEELGDEEASLLQDQAAAGRTLVVLDPGDAVDRAWAILRRAGALSEEELAQPADEPSEAEAAPPPTDPLAPAPPTAADQPTRVELAQDEPVARTRLVPAGEVLLHRKVVMETRTIEVEVMREELIVERRPAPARDPASTSALPEPEPGSLAARFRALKPGESLRLPLVEEQVEIRKLPVVYEEVAVGKELRRERRVLREPARREVLRLQRRGRVVVRAPHRATDEGPPPGET
jgi:stress response protein YsnF